MTTTLQQQPTIQGYYHQLLPYVNKILGTIEYTRQPTSQQRKVRSVIAGISTLLQEPEAVTLPKKRIRPQKQGQQLSIGNTIKLSPARLQSKGKRSDLQEKQHQDLMLARRAKMKVLKEIKLNNMSSEESFVADMRKGQEVQSIEANDSNQIDSAVADLKNRVFQTSTTFFLRTGLRREDNFKKYLLPYIEESKALAADHEIEDAFEDLELKEFRKKHREKVLRYLRWLELEAEKRQRRNKLLREQNKLDTKGNMTQRLNVSFAYNDVSKLGSLNNSLNVFQHSHRSQSHKVKANKPCEPQLAMNSSNIMDIINTFDFAKDSLRESQHLKDAHNIIQLCEDTSKRLNNLKGQFRNRKNKGSTDFGKLSNRVFINESQNFIEKQMIIFDT